MKKLAVLVMLAVLAGSVFAQETGKWTVGGRLGAAFGFHKPGEDVEDMVDMYEGFGMSVDKKLKPNFTLAAYGNYAFNERLSLQAELNFMINQGLKYEYSTFGVSFDLASTYKSLDIPVLVKYVFLQEPVIVGALGGPYLSIPFGDIEMDDAGSTAKADPKGIGFGAALGGFVHYPLGPGRIVGDLRFIFDFTTMEGEIQGATLEYISRRALVFTVGYEISF